MVILFLPAVVAVVGVLMYALCANPKLAELGRILFFCGILAMLLQYPAAARLVVR